MERLDVSGSFLIRDNPHGEGPETLVVVSAVKNDGEPWIDWTDSGDEVQLSIVLSATFGLLEIRLTIVDQVPMVSYGVRGFVVDVIDPDLPGPGQMPYFRPATMAITIDAPPFRGQGLACACGPAVPTVTVDEG
jgi:hypothetical protein